MRNYEYIIAGLPDLEFKEDNKKFSYEKIRDIIKSNCPETEAKYIDLLDLGNDENNLSEKFYASALECENSFIRNYFKLDLQIRNLKVIFLKRQDLVVVPSNSKIEPDPAEESQLKIIFGMTDLVARELALDKFVWDQVERLTIFNYFDINKILAFLVKARIVDRWNSLDKKTGEEMFRKLVDEVRGTFKGVEYKEK
ncbi:MAG: DUF2764 domain-containing protein [Bacteroidales bacterium]|jgi:hypothetical protein|nr:DUF2764 domain-containing protein [Bacteroidales bacterium]